MRRKNAINNGKPVVDKYKIGEDFRFCVSPTNEYINEYNVTDFKIVTSGDYWQLVTESGNLNKYIIPYFPVSKIPILRWIV